MKTIDEAFEYDHQPTDVFDLIADAAFQLDLIMHLGGKDAELVERTTTSEGKCRRAVMRLALIKVAKP